MTKERWAEVKKQIKDQFNIREEYEEDLDPGLAEVLEFDGPTTLMKVRYVTKPKLLDKKTTYSNRAGSNVKVDYVFSDDEFISHLEVYTLSVDTNDWEKIEAQSLF
ncbi:hypothetical protein C4566_00290 [Candidatus Parcubacteria bacterium]|nr:MAG: hypothetical protein C4566_00290 [Candidatus Parcubacteria bacterium]